MADAATTVAALRDIVRVFVAERQWEPYHSPKNLAMGLAVEAAELMEHFLWVDCEQSRALMSDPQKRLAVGDEIADVFCHLLNLVNVLQFDLSDEFRRKMAKNADKYPPPSGAQMKVEL
jgi:NTP pyrophosphatase (non-canonical NTP hydrolase)